MKKTAEDGPWFDDFDFVEFGDIGEFAVLCADSHDDPLIAAFDCAFQGVVSIRLMEESGDTRHYPHWRRDLMRLMDMRDALFPEALRRIRARNGNGSNPNEE